MPGLMRCLWSAAKEWRDQRRDFRLFRTFLDSDSPTKKWKAIGAATSSAKFLMLSLLEFANSELATFEVRIDHTLTDPLRKTWLPAPWVAHWRDLISSANRHDKCGLFGFLFVTDKAPVVIDVQPFLPSMEAFDAFDEATDGMRVEDFGKFNKDHATQYMEELDKLTASLETFKFSKVQRA